MAFVLDVWLVLGKSFFYFVVIFGGKCKNIL